MWGSIALLAAALAVTALTEDSDLPASGPRESENVPPHSPRHQASPAGWKLEGDDCLVLESKQEEEREDEIEDEKRANDADSKYSTCGFSRYQAAEEDNGDRIVGGRPARQNAHPWSAALKINGFLHYCGGSVIDRWTVLTAAHCVNWGRGALNTTVHVGGNDLKDDVGMIVRRVKRLKMHIHYDSLATDYDVALIELNRPLEFSRDVRPVCLPVVGDQFKEGSPATVSGWGYTSMDGMGTDALREVTVELMTNEECDRMYGKRDHVTERMICAGAKGGGKDACQGDSGGPLTLKRPTDGAALQVGIVSWGRGCALPQYPGVYTNVAHFGDWIRRHRAG